MAAFGAESQQASAQLEVNGWAKEAFQQTSIFCDLAHQVDHNFYVII